MADIPGSSSAPYFSPRKSTENFSRLCQLIMTICSDLFRTILSQYIKPENLRMELDSNRARLLKKGILNVEQSNLLYPAASHSKYLVSSDMDLSLLYILLRNICKIPKHQNGWGNTPKSGDKCLAACIERIRIHRNMISGHSTIGEIDNTLFQIIWSNLSSDIVKIEQVISGGNMFERGVDELLKCELNPSRAQKYVEAFRNVQSELLTKQEKINDVENTILNIGHQIAVKRAVAHSGPLSGNKSPYKTHQRTITRDHKSSESSKATDLNQMNLNTRDNVDRIDDLEDQNASLAKVLKDGFSELKEELKDGFVKEEKELKKELRAMRVGFADLKRELQKTQKEQIDRFYEREKELKRKLKKERRGLKIY